MDIEIDLSVSIATTRESWTLTDNSVFGTDSNPARADVAVYVNSYKMNFDNTVNETLTVTGNDEDPETDSSWDINYTADGWYRTYYVIIPDYTAGTYDIYDAVYDSGTVYRSKQDSNSESDLTNTTWWEEITDPATLAANKDTSSESLNINSLVYQRVFSADGQYDYANRLSDQCNCADCDEISSLQWYNLYAMLLDQIAIADSRSEVLDGEKLSRRIESEFISC